MKDNGIEVRVADYCAFCGDFEPDVKFYDNGLYYMPEE